jgi:hypothetical protein
MDKLPSKLKVWHKYALNFVRVLYNKTAMISLTNENEIFKEMHFDMFYNYDLMQSIINDFTPEKYIELFTICHYQMHFVPKNEEI